MRPNFTYGLTRAHLEALRRVPQRLLHEQRKSALLVHLGQVLEDSGEQARLSWAAFSAFLPNPSAATAANLTLAKHAIIRSAFVDPLPNYRQKLQARSTRFSSNAATVAITVAFATRHATLKA